MNKYEITINKKYLYIKNYFKIISINLSEIIIDLKDITINICGDNLIITKMDKYDLIIKGSIRGIQFKNE